MKNYYPQMLTMIAVAFLVTSIPALASEMDTQTESAAKESYVFKTYLKGDDVKVATKDGVVTLSGTVNQSSQKDLAQETAANLPGVKSVDNRLEIKTEAPLEKSNEGLPRR